MISEKTSTSFTIIVLILYFTILFIIFYDWKRLLLEIKPSGVALVLNVIFLLIVNNEFIYGQHKINFKTNLIPGHRIR